MHRTADLADLCIAHPGKRVTMDATTKDVSNRVEIRIRNDSNRDFDRVRVQFADQREVDYGSVSKGGISSYQTASRAYRYATVSVESADQELSFQPIDYMGERELPAGRYTYVLDVHDGQLTVQLDTDD